jgi:ribA/ribD-fused uncharacterized protein
MKYNIDYNEIRIYHKENSCIFKKNNEEYGELSNMAIGFPLRINGVEIKTTEALYQACRFPHHPEIQKKIIEQKSPMAVKMISNSNKKKSRIDWDSVRHKIMNWCIHVKLYQNFISFGAVLSKTGLKDIVENSSNDNFWGAIPNEDGTIFTGKNSLGRLLMDLRQKYYSMNNSQFLYIEPPTIENFLLYGEAIGEINETLSEQLDLLKEISKKNDFKNPEFDTLSTKQKHKNKKPDTSQLNLFETFEL